MEPSSPDIGNASAQVGVLADARQSLGPAQLDDLFPPPVIFRRSLRTFVVLLGLAAVIASFGLYQDSVASIIGAMVVAPLGGAIIAFAGALITARNRWMGITFIQVILGALAVIAIGFVVSLLMPQLLVLTPALEARTAPGILDLGVALAAGAAGAYVSVRRTGTDALPGVAIAVSLVPPLATVGICMELGRQADAAGALLLFGPTSPRSSLRPAWCSRSPVPRQVASSCASAIGCATGSSWPLLRSRSSPCRLC